MGQLPEVLAIVGPTAIGKTEVGIRVATELDGEIISADARQIYRYLNIGTAKPSSGEMRNIPHHMIDVVEPGEYFGAGKFGELGREHAADILTRGKTPIVVGGSGLYVRSLLDGLIEGNARDDLVRENISQEIKDFGIQSVYDRLMEIDSDYAENISPNDEVRIVRALEVYTLTGKTLTESFSDQNSSPHLNTLFAGLMMNREELVSRIEERVDKMIKDGLVDEVAKLIESGYAEKIKKLQTIGYSEVIEHLEGRINESTMLSEIKKHSRRYAKHQMTWFRSDSRIHWIDVGEISDPASQIIEYWNNRTALN